MPALSPAVAAVRGAVRRVLEADLGRDCPVSGGPPDGGPPDGRPRLILVACSGGADSLALAGATAFVAARHGLGCGLVTVDHGLQPGSATRAATLASWATGEGFAPVRVATVDAGNTSGGPGPEAAARAARYTALADAARETGAAAVLLGHTREDQAETVLLALARGGGPRGLAGMPRRRVINGIVFLRPLLDVARRDTSAACSALGLTPWEDPHNTDPAYARSRVRAALPLLVDVLGAGVVGNLARTAGLLAADVEFLDAVAAREAVAAVDSTGAMSIPVLAEMHRALRGRVLHRWALDLGSGGSELSSAHVAALEALVCRWRGQGPVALPGGIRVARVADRLVADLPVAWSGRGHDVARSAE